MVTGSLKPSSLKEFIPELENGCRERIRAIFREKQSRIFDFHHASCARYVVLQPIRPLLVEEDIFQAPYDQRRNLKGLKRGMNADSLRIIEAQPISLEGLDPLLRGQ